MKLSDITFHELSEFLFELGFHEVPDEVGHRFQHPAGTVLLFRPYKGKEKVAARDIQVLRPQLVYDGLIEPTNFDRFLQKATA